MFKVQTQLFAINLATKVISHATKVISCAKWIKQDRKLF